MAWLQQWLDFYLQRNPLLFRTLLRVADELGATPKLFFTRAEQVRSIFERSHDFQVGYTIAPRTKLGAFLLSMDEGPRHTREKRALTRAINNSLTTMARVATEESEELAQALAAAAITNGGRIDLASQFAERVFIRSLARCFGLPLDDWHSQHLDTERGERTLAVFIRTLGGTIGMGTPASFGLEQLADKVTPEVREQLTAVIEKRRSELQDDSLQAGDTVIDWLLAPRPQPDEDRALVEADAHYVQIDGLARSIGGLFAAGASFPKAFSNVLFELAQRKRLAELADQARVLEPAAWAQLCEAYVLEALRFRPAFPLLQRYCPRASAVGRSQVPAGSSIVLSPLAAMFDPAVVERPEELMPGRDKDVYLIFGAGARSCIGRELMLALFSPMLRALFVHLPEIREMQTGEYRYDGPALEHFWVTLSRNVPAEEAAKPAQVADSLPPLSAAAVADTPSGELPQISADLAARASAPPAAPSNMDGSQGGP